MTVNILYREEFREYDFGLGHPFRGDRYEIFPKVLKETVPPDGNYRIVACDNGTEEDLRLICSQAYIDFCTGYFKAANMGETFAGSMDFPSSSRWTISPGEDPANLRKPHA